MGFDTILYDILEIELIEINKMLTNRLIIKMPYLT